MPRLNQKGTIFQVLMLLILAAGILVGLYLVKNPQILKSRASNPAIVFKTMDGQDLPLNTTVDPPIPQTSGNSQGQFKIELTSPIDSSIGTKTFLISEDRLFSGVVEQKYTSDPTTTIYATNPGSKTIWVMFIGNDGQRLIKSAPIEILPNTSPTANIKINLSPANIDLTVNNTATVNILADIPDTTRLVEWTYNLNFDPKIITAINCSSSKGGGCNNKQDGQSFISGTDTSGGISGNTSIGTVTFKAIAPGTSKLSLTIQQLMDTHGVKATTDLSEGTVTVTTIPVPTVTVSAAEPKVAIDNSTGNLNIVIPQTVTNASLGLSVTTSGDNKQANIPANVNVNAATSLGNVNMAIPENTKVSGPSNWDGNLSLPVVTQNSSVSIPKQNNVDQTVTSVIEVGLADTKISFGRGVRLLIPGKADSLVGYSRGGNFTQITTKCSGDLQSVGDTLPADGDCSINSGSDLAVWTKHFTKFVTYAPTATAQSNNSSGGSSGGGGSTSAPVCTDIKPASAPVITNITPGENSATISWSKAKDPVTQYLIAYGTESKKPKYGNPNVGNKNTTSYQVNGLSGNTKYYFQIKAINNCMPGDYSNEVSVVSTGKITSGIASGFKEGVLGKSLVKIAPVVDTGTPKSANFIETLRNILLNFFSKIASIFSKKY